MWTAEVARTNTRKEKFHEKDGFLVDRICSGVRYFRLHSASTGHADEEVAPVYGVKLPAGYRDWTSISVARFGGPVNDIRAKLGNDVAIKAYREDKLPFPDGTIIARLAWNQVASRRKAMRPYGGRSSPRHKPDAVQKILSESLVAGTPRNVQFMVKDSTKYASTGGWGFAEFDEGKPAGDATHRTCFSCHAPAKDHDFVFTRYAR